MKWKRGLLVAVAAVAMAGFARSGAASTCLDAMLFEFALKGPGLPRPVSRAEVMQTLRTRLAGLRGEPRELLPEVGEEVSMSGTGRYSRPLPAPLGRNHSEWGDARWSYWLGEDHSRLVFVVEEPRENGYHFQFQLGREDTVTRFEKTEDLVVVEVVAAGGRRATRLTLQGGSPQSKPTWVKIERGERGAVGAFFDMGFRWAELTLLPFQSIGG